VNEEMSGYVDDFGTRFGLMHVDFKTEKRTPKMMPRRSAKPPRAMPSLESEWDVRSLRVVFGK
jgi:hypothetical protein